MVLHRPVDLAGVTGKLATTQKRPLRCERGNNLDKARCLNHLAFLDCPQLAYLAYTKGETAVGTIGV